jgi:hypothetical protein
MGYFFRFEFLMILLLSSCIATTEGNYQRVKIISKNIKTLDLIEGVHCEVSKDNYLIASDKTPFWLDLKKSDGDNIKSPILITCHHPDYKITTPHGGKLESKRVKNFYDNLTNPITLIPGLLDIPLRNDKSYNKIYTIFIEN